MGVDDLNVQFPKDVTFVGREHWDGISLVSTERFCSKIVDVSLFLRMVLWFRGKEEYLVTL